MWRKVMEQMHHQGIGDYLYSLSLCLYFLGPFFVLYRASNVKDSHTEHKTRLLISYCFLATLAHLCLSRNTHLRLREQRPVHISEGYRV